MKYINCDSLLEHKNFKKDLKEQKSLCCNNDYQQSFDEQVKKGFFNLYTFSTHDKNKFLLMLQNGVYPNEYVDMGRNQ